LNREILSVKQLTKIYKVRTGFLRRTTRIVKAVDRVYFSLVQGETLALVGESGSGKTSIARIIAREIPPTSGEVLFLGKSVWNLHGKELKDFRRNLGLIFQDPFESFNPRMKIIDSVTEPLAINNLFSEQERKNIAKSLLIRVGLSEQDLEKLPHQFSGGQLQRIAIARAMSTRPLLIIADEPVSSLDISTQAKVLQLMKEIQLESGVSYLLISHDLGIVKLVSNRVAVLYLGSIMEIASANDIFKNPLHPYTQYLLSAVLVPDPRILRERMPKLLASDVASQISHEVGCKFSAKCPYATRKCEESDPPLEIAGGEFGHYVACFYWEEIKKGVLKPRY
jgi:oligopeptide/dipeptide ABC transporter ATP-binding protein